MAVGYKPLLIPDATLRIRRRIIGGTRHASGSWPTTLRPTAAVKDHLREVAQEYDRLAERIGDDRASEEYGGLR